MSSNNLSVIFDISVLGMGTRNPAARTGVFRASENLLNGFLHHPEISLSLNSAPQHLDAAKEYLQLKQLLGHESSDSRKSFPGQKGLLKLFFAHPGIPLKNNMRLYTNQFVKTDIFHSPWLPIHQHYARSNKVQSFINVHDLIPLLFPDFFTEGNVHQFKKNINSITPDTWVICNSISTKNDLLNYHPNLDTQKVFVTYWAASDLFHPVSDETIIQQTKQKYGIPDSPYVLSLATIEPRKNIKTLLVAFRELIMQEKIQDLNLVLVGTKGWKYEEIIEFMDASLELSSRVFFTGYIDDNDLAAVYSGAMIFVYPSFYEGFGLPPLEAMQCGVPVICSNSSSLPEVVGVAGILVEPADHQALSSEILKLYRCNESRDQLRTEALKQASKFHWKDCVNQTIHAYRCSLSSLESHKNFT